MISQIEKLLVVPLGLLIPSDLGAGDRMVPILVSGAVAVVPVLTANCSTLGCGPILFCTKKVHLPSQNSSV